MTIKLLCAWGGYPANAIVTLDAGTESGLIADKTASSDTTGGVPYVAPTPQKQFTPVVASVDVTGGVTKIWAGTQTQYDTIAAPADDTLYIIIRAM